MADNFYRIKNGLNLPTLSADPTVTPPANSSPGDMAVYGNELYHRTASAWEKVPSGPVETAEIANSAVTTDKINNSAVTTDKINANAVTAAKIANGTITDTQVSATAAINASKLASQSITDTQVSLTAAIAGSKISPDFGSQNVTTTGNISGAAYTLNSSAFTSVATSYTLQSTDNGKVLAVTSATAINITVPTGLPDGFRCTVIQTSTGQVTFVASGTTLNSPFGLKTAVQHSAVSIIRYGTDIFNISGNTTA